MDFIVYTAFILTALYIAAELNGQTPAAPIATVEPATTPTYTVAEAAALVPAPPAIAAPIQAPARVVVATPATDLATLPSAELRRRCQAAGIRWRNARPDGKHLRKGEMLQALSQ